MMKPQSGGGGTSPVEPPGVDHEVKTVVTQTVEGEDGNIVALAKTTRGIGLAAASPKSKPADDGQANPGALTSELADGGKHEVPPEQHTGGLTQVIDVPVCRRVVWRKDVVQPPPPLQLPDSVVIPGRVLLRRRLDD